MKACAWQWTLNVQIETIGKFQLHLIAQELADGNKWDPFVRILKFDDSQQDFVCVMETRHAGEPCVSYAAAIEAARRFGTDCINAGSLNGLAAMPSKAGKILPIHPA